MRHLTRADPGAAAWETCASVVKDRHNVLTLCATFRCALIANPKPPYLLSNFTLSRQKLPGFSPEPTKYTLSHRKNHSVAYGRSL